MLSGNTRERDEVMATHKSALKRMRQGEKRRLRNRTHVGNMRSQVRKFQTAVAEGNTEVAEAELKKSIVIIGRTCSHGVIHKNAASRKVSRLTKAYNKLVAAG